VFPMSSLKQYSSIDKGNGVGGQCTIPSIIQLVWQGIVQLSDPRNY
jgi:hypothetical protein